METVTVILDMPKDVLLAADISETNAPLDIKKYLALYLFKERMLSFGKAAELAEMDKLSFLELTGSKNISLNYDADDYLEDFHTVQGMEL